MIELKLVHVGFYELIVRPMKPNKFQTILKKFDPEFGGVFEEEFDEWLEMKKYIDDFSNYFDNDEWVKFNSLLIHLMHNA